MTSPWFPQVIVAVSPRSAVTVPSRRTGGGLRGPEVEGLKACRWEGRTRGVWRDMFVFVWLSIFSLRRFEWRSFLR